MIASACPLKIEAGKDAELPKHSILTVDDGSSIWRVLRKVLTLNGYDVMGAARWGRGTTPRALANFPVDHDGPYDEPVGWCGYHLCLAERA